MSKYSHEVDHKKRGIHTEPVTTAGGGLKYRY